MGRLIAIAGNIGSGKTTLAKHLSIHMGWKSLLEDTLINPYVDDFYNEMRRWSFNMQIYYLKTRFKRIIDSQQRSETVVQDRTIYEDVSIFAPSLNAMGLMSDRDFKTYCDLFDLIDSLIKPPDLLIYIRNTPPNLLTQIKKRGYKFESKISISYLQRLNERYEAWIYDYQHNHVIIDGEKYNFSQDDNDLNLIISMIRENIDY